MTGSHSVCGAFSYLPAAARALAVALGVPGAEDPGLLRAETVSQAIFWSSRAVACGRSTSGTVFSMSTTPSFDTGWPMITDAAPRGSWAVIVA